MKIIYSFNKRDFGEEYWRREISSASSEEYIFIPFNHDPYLDVSLYSRAQLLDNLYFANHPGLLRMYADLEELIRVENADMQIVDNCFSYLPEF